MSEMLAISDADRAAVILMLMDDDQASRLLGQLQPEELQVVGEKMLALGDVGTDRIAGAIEGFVRHADDNSLSSHDRPAQLRSRMTKALGEVRADSIMQRIVPDEAPRSLELARWLAAPVLLPLVEGEHPQAIAVLLLLLEPQPAAELLSLLPPHLQPDLVERIARMQKVSTHAMAMLDEMLSARIAQRFGKGSLELGGAREAAELINLAAGHVGRSVMPAISERDADLARAIEAELVTFEMLFVLSAMDMGRLLRDVEGEVLVDALKGLEEEQRDCFFAAMSSRAADGVRDDIEMRGRLKKEDVNVAQKRIVEVARKLADEGEISLGGGDGEFV
ncbi:flagellar motor switch protein FliG [Alteraurantiacibacter aquimixticola]|uniref:Flagellar motor switch protein FliG n=1 Tax=Alteraurantiacibacter aquimixticola TaxID=2489173 RepID=A0A4T3F4X5_9SPHN|nr:FliG C-terminal domain-containing protein [Alteraurantiacibacter aquimixticola]TIX51529.1 flagellar motor switch protein FliG [Alteraurantiacibacter aquimixticola]